MIAEFDVEDGAVTNLEIVAAVPEDRFETQVLETIAPWVWEADAGQVAGKTCTMSREDIPLPLVFAID